LDGYVSLANVFVFGSNLAGRHGKGAALHARKHYGAVYGEGVGRTGNAYAIPTKNERLEVLPLITIGEFIDNFIEYAYATPEDTFLLTPIGTGLAGYDRTEIFKLIRNCDPLPSNIVFTKEWMGM
jgi:hypothetical protein